MTEKERLISRIVDKEWAMFQNVSNIGGRASCQDDRATFEIMRSSQAGAWPEDVLASYLDDLEAAEKEGRNLLTEKYARMMESTSPAEYALIEHMLPPLEPEALRLIEEIMSISLEWEKELWQKYPYVMRRGRPAFSSQDTPYVTSTETYLRGELSTYSPRTLDLYYKNLLRQKSGNINGAEIILENTIRRYGYSSLKEANEKLKKRQNTSNQ